MARAVDCFGGRSCLTAHRCNPRKAAVASERSRGAPGGTRQGLMLRRSSLRADCTAVLAPGSCRVTRYALRAALEQTRQVRGRSARVRAPTPVLRSSSPHKSPLSGAARREAAAVLPDDNPTALPRSRRRAGRDAPERRREAQRRWPRAQRASTSDLAHLFERSAQARSELCARPGPRASQGSRRSRPPNRSFAACPAPASPRTHRPYSGP